MRRSSDDQSDAGFQPAGAGWKPASPSADQFATLDQIIRTRRSVRRFRPDPIDTGLIRRLIETATWAPCAGNRQDWEFSVVSSPGLKQELAAAVRDRWQSILSGPDAGGAAEELQAYARYFDWFWQAPVVIAISARAPEAVFRHLLGAQAADVCGARTSAAMAAQNLMLAAHAGGLATCCLNGPVAAAETMKTLLALGRRADIVCLIAMGWPDESPAPPPRKPVEEVTRFYE